MFHINACVLTVQKLRQIKSYVLIFVSHTPNRAFIHLLQKKKKKKKKPSTSRHGKNITNTSALSNFKINE